MNTTVQTLHVAFGPRGYDIQIQAGLLARCAAHITAHKALLVVTDETVAQHHLPTLMTSLEGVVPIILPSGEQTKSFAHLERLCAAILEAKPTRETMILAVGGGVVGDLAGLAASLVLRGLPLIHVPTTLLAQVDSAIGGKTAINTSHGKNLLGTFYQPQKVLIDPLVLKTLPLRAFRSGYAEVVKYAFIKDVEFFQWLEAHHKAVFAQESAALLHAITRSCQIKAAVVAADEREQTERAVLNLGHTFGHALEGATGFSERLTHGEAVALGMVLAFELAAARQRCSAQEVARVRAHLRAVGLPTRLQDLPGTVPSAQTLVEFMSRDKKRTQDGIRLVLPRGIGAVSLEAGDPHTLIQFLEDQKDAA